MEKEATIINIAAEVVAQPTEQQIKRQGNASTTRPVE